MDEVSEVMSILIGLGKGAAMTAEEIVKMTIRLLSNAGDIIKGRNNNEKKGMLGKGKEAIKNVIPFVGQTGKITRGELARLSGDTQHVQLKSEDLKEFQKLCKKYRVGFNVVKLDNGDYHAFFKASDVDTISACMEQLAVKKYNMTQAEVDELKQPEITAKDFEKAKNEDCPALPCLDKQMTYAKQDWKLTDRKDGQIEYRAENGIYDLSAQVDGSYTVSKMGKEVYRGEKSSLECNGLKTAMLNASLVAMADKRNLNKAQNKTVEAVKGVGSKKVEKLRDTMSAKTPAQANKLAKSQAEKMNANKQRSKTKTQVKGAR